MKKCLVFCIMLTIALVPSLISAQHSYKQPVTVSISATPADSKGLFEMVISLSMENGVHVYRDESQFFKIHIENSSQLGESDIFLPETIPYKNFDDSVVAVFEGQKDIIVQKSFSGKSGETWSITGYFQYQACTNETCFPPTKIPFSFSGIIPPNAQQNTSIPPAESESPYAKGLWLGILGAFFAGVLLSLTPCVYPMIGITVAIIGGTHASKAKTILMTAIYMLGLSLVYAATGVVVAVIGSAAASFFRSSWVLVPIGIIFILLGISMFDVFSIQTSSAFSVKVQEFSGKFRGSYLATFLIGALSAFVVGPCVSGPVIGLITFVANTGDIFKGFAYFFALAWGMGILLFIAGSASTILPRAGLWMERIKHTLGIILIWAAFYFTRPLVGETVFATASIVCLALALQVLGLLIVPHPPFSFKNMSAVIVGVSLFSAIVYMHIEHGNTLPSEAGKSGAVDLDSIVALSDKPVILDFSAPWCSICKEIKETTLSKQSVKDKLTEFTFVHIDYDSNPHLVKKYGIIGPPAFIFIDKSGKQIIDTIVSGEVLEKHLFSFDKRLFK
ncbi:thioredoxin fold domain-containing protein [bacterium]|nr:thioredoxin fold domain-containing protein [bacterium]